MNPDMFPIAMFGLKNIGKESKYQGLFEGYKMIEIHKTLKARKRKGSD